MQTRSQLLAQALRAAGLEVITHVPGHGATQAFQPLGLPHSYHEEPAWTVAHGAALAGTRAAALFKAHGMLKAANSLSTSLTAGVTAALLGLVFEDPQASHSDNVLESGPFLRALGFEVLPVEDPLAVFQAVEWSERNRLPLMLEFQADRMEDLLPAPTWPELPASPPYRANPAAHLVCPMLAGAQARRLQQKRQGLTPQALPELPDWRSFPRFRDRLERLQPYIEALAATSPGWVSGDTGLVSFFGLNPHRLVEATTYLGGSLPLAVGAYLAGRRPAWAVTGDFSFLAAGHLGLVEARLREIPLKVALFWNGEAAVTGGQAVDRGLLETLLAGYRHRFVTGDPLPHFARAAASEELEILICDVQESFSSSS